MRLKARLNFTGQWSQIIPEVAKQCGMTVDQYCERAVMLVTKQGLEGGESNTTQQGIEQGEPHGSRSEKSSVADGPVPPSEDDSSAALADTQDTSPT